MAITLLSALIIMAAYFLILYASVAFIQDKCFFSSAPKENLDAIPDKKERFRGAHVIGWIIGILAILMFGFGFGRFFARFIVILYIMELYDIAFFDWVLLCHSNFFPHFYPELKGVVGSHQFGYNKKSHITHFIVYIPVCAALAGICMLF